MLESAVLALSYVEGMSKDDFVADRRTRQAVVMNLLIIGEMAGRLARDHNEFCAKYPDAPWLKMTSMRNRIAHGYFELDLDIVWDTVNYSLPELIAFLEPIHKELLRQDSRC
ncbi:HepT-like ribonuclease domain-containing protein [Methylocystis bryophila]|nr:DUF86 domain-containing protein [Methylocystis bryophila]